MKKETNLLKKTMTRKAYAEQMKLGRSNAGQGQNLGVRYFKSKKDYNRTALKEQLIREAYGRSDET